MQRYLIDHALKNVWCNPQQDNQLVIAPKRLTRDNGEINRFTLMNRKVSLPASGKHYHVYQIGQILPVVLGLRPLSGDWEPQRWIKFSDAMSTQKLIVNLYNTEGINIPKHTSYYMFSDDRDLVLAIEIDTKIPVDFKQDQIYLRLYSNAFYQSSRSSLIDDYVSCDGRRILTTQDVLELQSTVSGLRTKDGLVTCYVNGLFVNDINLATAAIGDVVEYVYDSSVKRVVTFTADSLLTFNSTLDSKYKYLLHHLDGNNDTIDYQDDIDIHVVHTLAANSKRGVYYHRNAPDSHRMVTHRDYAIAVDYFEHLVTALTEKLNAGSLARNTLTIEMTIRNSGYHRPLVYDNNRVFELYKLPNDKIVKAMIGLNATLDVWKAENLENSAYTRLMRLKTPTLPMELIEDAYGYNAISKVVGDTPVKTTLNVGSQLANINIGLQTNSTVYEYDENGYLNGFYYHANGSQYIAQNNSTRLLEVISGRGSFRPSTLFGTNNIPIPTVGNYRVYMCFLNGGIPNNVWRDVTGTSAYHIDNGRVVWDSQEYDQFLMVRNDDTFLAYDVDVVSVDGMISLVISEEEDRGNGFVNTTLPVPMGEIDVFLNGKSLINGLDYIVKFPKIHILNKTYLLQPAISEIQKVHVRCTGFCNSDLEMELPDDYGFIQHGLLSNNSRFDIRDDKVLRITVDGGCKHRSDIQFSEEHSGISITDVRNGKPYQIKDMVVPLRQLTDGNTYTLRKKSLDIDKAVSEYLTVRVPQPSRGDLMSIPTKHVVVSPFLSRVINAIDNREIPLSLVDNSPTDMQLIEACSPFEYLLEFDPINPDNNFDYDFIKIAPHRYNTVVNLSLNQYRALTKIVKLYADGLIDLASFVNFNN